MLFTFIPIACLGYAMYAFAENVHEAMAAMKVIYIGGCFLQYFIMMSVFNLCQIRVNRWIRTALFFICVVLYASVATIGYRGWRSITGGGTRKGDIRGMTPLTRIPK